MIAPQWCIWCIYTYLLDPSLRKVWRVFRIKRGEKMHLDAPDTPSDTLPEIPTHVERASNGVWDLLVTCPFCGDTHRHGGGSSAEPVLGPRLSHCVSGELVRSYVLIAGPADMAKPERKLRSGRTGRPSR